MVLLFSCEANQPAEKELTFEDIEKEFGFERPLSEKSKELILKNCDLYEYKDLISSLAKNRDKRKSSSILKSSCATYNVCLKFPFDDYHVECIPVSDNDYILDIAEDYNIDLPYSCRCGACSTCLGRLTSGSIDNSEDCFLDDYQKYYGFCTLCVTSPRSDVVILTDQELYMW